jgi:hypothetical protein
MRYAPLHLLALGAVGLCARVALAQPQVREQGPVGAAAAAVANAQSVPLPYALRDSTGLIWSVNPDGSVSDGAGELFNAGGQLWMGQNVQYAPPIQQASFDVDHNELMFPPQPLGGLNVSRRVAVDARGAWCRWVEVLENTSPNRVKAQLRVVFALSLPVQGVEQVADERRGGAPLGVAVFDGQHGIAMVGAARGSRLSPQFVAQQNTEAVEFTYEVEVPARRTVAVAHVHARRATINEAIAFMRSTKERDWLRGLPRQVVSWLANFPAADHFAGGAEILRGDLLDVVELRGGDLYKGTLKESAFKLQTPYGLVELPAERVVAMVTLGEFRPTQLLVTGDGQIFGGTLEAEGGVLHLELSSGQVTKVPIRTVRRFGYRGRAGEEAGDAAAGADGAPAPAGDRPMVMLRTGDRVAVEMPAGPIGVATCYGLLRLEPQTIASISFQSEEHEHGVHEVRLTDGSRFAGIVAQARFDVKLAGAGPGGATGAGTNAGATSAPRAASFASTGISRLQLAKEPEEPGPDAATVTLSNGDVLVGGMVGKLVLETAFDAIEVDAAELRALRPGGGNGAGSAPAPTEVQLTLWDGATLSGRLRGDALDCKLGCGATVKVPVALVQQYAQPQPRPPTQAVERIKAVVAELNADDWKARDRAASQLAALGPGAAVVLKGLREGQPPEVRQRIDQILASYEAPSRAAPQPRAAPPGGAVAPNPPADVDVQVAPQERG